jgi:hypothetical protein
MIPIPLVRIEHAHAHLGALPGQDCDPAAPRRDWRDSRRHVERQAQVQELGSPIVREGVVVSFEPVNLPQ